MLIDYSTKGLYNGFYLMELQGRVKLILVGEANHDTSPLGEHADIKLLFMMRGCVLHNK